MKYTIEDLAAGRCAVKNDGTLEELKEVLKLAFPSDKTNTNGTCTFYHKISGGSSWVTSNNTNIPTQSVKDFISKDNPETQESILQEAERIVNGDRATDYGDMKESFEKIAKGWSVIANAEISAKQVGLMMIWLKMMRENNAHKRDNLVDVAGYAHCVNEVV